jgi:hypothetical protein
MKLNQDSLFAIIGTNLPAGRPTSDFYALNSYSDLHAPEDAVIEVNHYSQAYKSLELVNVPKFGTFAFFTHTGTNSARFTQIEARHNVLNDVMQLESVKFVTEADRLDAVRYLSLKYAILGQFLLISRSPNTGNIVSVYG